MTPRTTLRLVTCQTLRPSTNSQLTLPWRQLGHFAADPCGVLAEQYATKLLEAGGRIIEGDQDRLSFWDGEGEDSGAAAIRGLEPASQVGVVDQACERQHELIPYWETGEVGDRRNVAGRVSRTQTRRAAIGATGGTRIRDDRLAVRFFRRRNEGAQSRAAEALTLHAAGTVEVVGESFRQDTLERLARIATGPEPYLEDLKGRARSRTRNPKLLWFQGGAAARAEQSA